VAKSDGSKMRSGSFKDGVQAGEWTTYDRKGRVVRRFGSRARVSEGWLTVRDNFRNWWVGVTARSGVWQTLDRNLISGSAQNEGPSLPRQM
jgi:hypothetical protein